MSKAEYSVKDAKIFASLLNIMKKEIKEEREKLQDLIENIELVEGPAGPAGPAGGPQGPQGERGKQARGIKNTEIKEGILIATYTDDKRQVIGEVVGPRGPQGLQGPGGKQGPIGITGPRGERGPRGPAGLKGDKGSMGPVGPVGLVGPKGGEGEKGDAGRQGLRGVIGPAGLKGDKGPMGPQGPQGLMGAPGPKGEFDQAKFNNVEKKLDEKITLFSGEINTRINRLMMSSGGIGSSGGGEVRLEFLDDVDRSSVKTDGYYLKYDAASNKFIGAAISGGGAGSGDVSNTYLQTTFVSNTNFQLALSNTNSYIATKLNSSSYTAADVQSKAALANTNTYIATKISNNVTTTLQTQSIIPAANNTYSLGSPEKRFKDLYVSANSIVLGIATLTSNSSGGLTVTPEGGSAVTYAPLSSPTFTGTPIAPTASVGTNTTQLATTAFVRTEVSALVNAAPSTLDTLNELAAALGDDPDFATTVTASIGTKAANSYVNILLSNTNSYIATKLNSSSYTTADVQSKAALSNTNSYIATKTDESTSLLRLSNTNSYIGSVGVSSASYSEGNTTITLTHPNSSTTKFSLSGIGTGGGDVSNTYLQATFVSNTAFQSFVANTNPRFDQYLQVANTAPIDTVAATTNSLSSNQVMDSVSASSYRTLKYLVQVTETANNYYHSTEILLTHNGSSVIKTEYATIFTFGSLGSFDADINTGNIRLLFSPTYSNNEIKLIRTTIAI